MVYYSIYHTPSPNMPNKCRNAPSVARFCATWLQTEWSNTKTQGFGWEVLNRGKGFHSYIHSILGSKFSASQGILRSPVAAIERRKSTIQPQWVLLRQILCVSWGIINTVAHGITWLLYIFPFKVSRNCNWLAVPLIEKETTIEYPLVISHVAINGHRNSGLSQL